MESKVRKYKNYLIPISLFAIVGLWTILSVLIATILAFIDIAFKTNLLEVNGLLSSLGLITLVSSIAIESFLGSRMITGYSKEFKESCKSCKYNKGDFVNR